MKKSSTALSDDVPTEPEPNNVGEKHYNTLIIDFLSIIFLTFGRADFSLFHKNSQRTSVDIVTRAGKQKKLNYWTLTDIKQQGKH